jgi:putative ABC transport system permease protein
VQRETDYYRKAAELTAGFLSAIGTIVAILFAIAAILGALITMNGAVAHRTKEIGTLRALGFSRFSILTSFLLEALFLAVISGAIGVALTSLLSFVEIRTMNFMTFSDIVIKFRLTPAIIVSALKVSIIMGLIGGIVPAIRAALVSPVEAMRA